MYRAGFRTVRNLEANPAIQAGQVYTFRQRLEPYMSIDTHKSFFNLIDSVSRVAVRVVGDVPTGYDYVTSATTFQSYVRSENHFLNAIGSFRILINGTVVEEWTNNVGEMDAILKRLNYSNAYNVFPDHQNFNKSFSDRYVETNITKREYQIVPEFSKFWRLTDQIRGGIDLQIEITIHPNYLTRVLHAGLGTLPYTRADGTAIGGGGGVLATDILTPTRAIVANNYILNSLDLYLWIEEYSNVSPIMAPLTYNQESWRIEKRQLAVSTDHYYEITVGKGVKQFGFVFQANQNINMQVGNFAGSPSFTRGSGALTTFPTTHNYYLFTSQAKQLVSYEVEYGKNKLPYVTLNQKFDPVNAPQTNTTRFQSFARQLNYGNLLDMCGTFPYYNESSTGPIYLEKFHEHNDTDQNVIKLKLVFSTAVNNLSMYYFYNYDTTTEISYDGSGNAVQVIPQY